MGGAFGLGVELVERRSLRKLRPAPGKRVKNRKNKREKGRGKGEGSIISK
jgi:hypothetical protein